MSTLHAKLACVLALVCCSSGSEVTRLPLRDFPVTSLKASLRQTNGAYDVTLSVAYSDAQNRCLDLAGDVTASMGNLGMVRKPVSTDRAGHCVSGPAFELLGVVLPAVGEDGFRLVGGEGTAFTMGVRGLLRPRTVTLASPATSLRIGVRAFLDFQGDVPSEVWVSFLPDVAVLDDAGKAVPSFSLSSTKVGAEAVDHDDRGWSFVVPAVKAGAGQLEVYTFGNLEVTSCQGAPACIAEGAVVRVLRTEVAP